MVGNDMSVADVMAIARTTGESDQNNGFGGNGSWFFILFLFFLLAGGNGLGFGNNNNNCCTPATQQGVTDAFNFNQLDNGIRGIERGLCDTTFAIQNMTNTLSSQINESRFDMQKCCCDTQRSIDSVKFEVARGFCDVVNSNNINTRDIIANNTANTQRIIDVINENTVQDLRDKLAGANNVLAQDGQSRYLLSQLGRYVTNPPCNYPYHHFC